MTSTHQIKVEKSLEEFLEQDLPFLVKPHFKDTLTIILEYLKFFHVSIDVILEQYPNFIETLNIQIYLYFAERMNKKVFTANSDFYQYYCAIAVDYQSQFIYSVAESQIKSQYIQNIINNQRNIEVSFFNS